MDFLASRVLIRLPLILQPFEQATIIDCPCSVLVEKPILIFAHVVQHLPFREATQPAVVLPKNTKLKGHHLDVMLS